MQNRNIKNMNINFDKITKTLGIGAALVITSIILSKNLQDLVSTFDTKTSKTIENNKNNTCLDECLEGKTIVLDNEEVLLTEAVDKLEENLKIIELTKNLKLNSKNKFLLARKAENFNKDLNSENVKILISKYQLELNENKKDKYREQLIDITKHAKEYVKKHSRLILKELQLTTVKAKSLDALNLNEKDFSTIEIKSDRYETNEDISNNWVICTLDSKNNITEKFDTILIMNDVIENIYCLQDKNYNLTYGKSEEMLEINEKLIKEKTKVNNGIIEFFSGRRSIK